MLSRLLALALLLLPASALAGVKEKVAALAPSGLVLVMDAKGNELVAQNADAPFVPASVTKIVTAWLALEVLGGDYRFETRFFTTPERLVADRCSAGFSAGHYRLKSPSVRNDRVGTLIGEPIALRRVL